MFFIFYFTTVSSAVELMLSPQPHIRQVSQGSSLTWTWALNVPESCWCLVFTWPKSQWRDLSLRAVQQVQTQTLWYPLSWVDPVRLCAIWMLWFVYLLRAKMSPGGRLCWTIRGLSAQWLRVHWGVCREDEYWGEWFFLLCSYWFI